MQPRFNYGKSAPGVYDAMDALDQYLAGCSVEEPLLHLVRLRASQLNGCAYCIDMHWKDLRSLGETEQRLYALAAWRECPWYSDRERAALEWTEAVTFIGEHHAPDPVYQATKTHFTETELCDLTLAIATISAWNRLSIASRLAPGSYQPAKASAAT